MGDDKGGLDLKSPFDDDSHTFHDGALPRYFRMRKWFFLTAMLLILLDTNWLDFPALTKALQVPSLPREIVHSALTATAAYLVVQASFIVIQIAITYRESLLARVSGIQAKGIEELRREIGSAEQQLRDYRESRDRLMQERTRQENTLYMDDSGKLKEAEQQRVTDALDKLSREARYLSETVFSLGGELERSIGNAGNARRIIGASEIALDLMRVAPTFGYLIYALLAHGSLSALQPPH